MAVNIRRSFSLQFKLERVGEVECGESLNSVARRHDISRGSLQKWIKSKEKMRNSNNKRQLRRLSGCGRKAQQPHLDQMLFEFFEMRREKNLSVTYNILKKEIERLRPELELPETFIASTKYIYGFTRRYHITCRKSTHIGQQTNKPPHHMRASIIEYYEDVHREVDGVENKNVFNFDQTPMYFDMCRSYTLHFFGAQDVNINHSGHMKTRFTVAVTATLDGTFLTALIVFGGLKKVPRVDLPSNILVAVSESGSMNSEMMTEWARAVLSNQGSAQKSVLIPE
jgi:hypothetical protein